MSAATQIRDAHKPAVDLRRGQRAWIGVWFGFVVLNTIACTIVWLDGVVPHPGDNVRQVLTALIAFVGCVYIVRRRPSFTITRSRVGEALLLLCSLLVCITGFFHVTRAYFMANIGLLISFVFACWGLQRGKKFLPIVFLSLFLLPDLPEEFRANLAIPLEHISTTLSASLASLFIPITYAGHVFYIKGAAYDVAPSCSGLGMWSCFLFAFAIWQVFKSYKPSGYLVMFLLDPLLMVALNTVRLFLTALVGFYGSQDMAIAIHSKLELVLIPLGLLLLLRAGKSFESR